MDKNLQCCQVDGRGFDEQISRRTKIWGVNSHGAVYTGGVSSHCFVGEMCRKTSPDRRLKESKSHFLLTHTRQFPEAVLLFL